MARVDDEFDEFQDNLDNEFELEITDLAPDEEAGVSVALVAEGLRVLSRVRARARDTSYELVEQGKQRLDDTRDWLMQEETDTYILEQSPHSEFELHVTSLPPEEIEHTRWTLLYTALGERLALQKRIWRVGIAVATIILILATIFATIPNLRSIITNLFPRPAQSTTYSSAIYLTSSGDNSQNNDRFPSVPFSSQGVVTFSGGEGQDVGKYPLSPRPMPANCPPGPVVNDSHTVGSTPIWISGFSGPRAAIHLPDVPSRSIPQWQGWAVHIVITVPTDYTEPVNITGMNLLNGMSLSFQLDGSNLIVPLLMLNPLHPTGLHTIVDGESGISWNVTMYVRASGCYVLNTSWPEGEWNIHFAAGL